MMRAGVLAEFDTPDAVLEAARRLRAAGFRRIDAFTPWPVKGMEEVLELGRPAISRVVFACAMLGAVVGYGIQWWTAARHYPLIVGARPPHAWPAFVLITFETSVLFGGIAAFVSAFAFSGLPRLWQPIFDVEGFERASLDRFFLAVDARDPSFDAEHLQNELRAMNALRTMPFGGERPREE